MFVLEMMTVNKMPAKAALVCMVNVILLLIGNIHVHALGADLGKIVKVRILVGIHHVKMVQRVTHQVFIILVNVKKDLMVLNVN